MTVTGGPPTIYKITPASGPAGTKVKVKGAFLDNVTKVTISDQEVTIVSDSSTLLKIKISARATTGKIKP